MGLRNGMELRPAVASVSATRNHRGINHDIVLGGFARHRPYSMGYDLLRGHNCDQSVWCQRFVQCSIATDLGNHPSD
jgi:hypothetical protein